MTIVVPLHDLRSWHQKTHQFTRFLSLDWAISILLILSKPTAKVSCLVILSDRAKHDTKVLIYILERLKITLCLFSSMWAEHHRLNGRKRNVNCLWIIFHSAIINEFRRAASWRRWFFHSTVSWWMALTVKRVSFEALCYFTCQIGLSISRTVNTPGIVLHDRRDLSIIFCNYFGFLSIIIGFLWSSLTIIFEFFCRCFCKRSVIDIQIRLIRQAEMYSRRKCLFGFQFLAFDNFFRSKIPPAFKKLQKIFVSRLDDYNLIANIQRKHVFEIFPKQFSVLVCLLSRKTEHFWDRRALKPFLINLTPWHDQYSNENIFPSDSI